jgi:hypothetical protein
MESSLTRENRVVLDAVQAALGLISREMRAISVCTEPGRIVLHVAVREWTPQVEEDVDDLIYELDALQDRSVEIKASVHVGEPSATWPGSLGRRVHVAKQT